MRKILIGVGAIATSLLFAGVASAATVVVTPGNMQGWAFINDNTNGAGTGTMVVGPATPPLGIGSAQLTTANSSDGQLLESQIDLGTKLSALTTLSYSTYQSASNPSNATAIALQFNVAQDATDASAGWQGRIVYEPYYNNGGTVPLGTWTTWDALDSGNGLWWFSKPSDFGGNCPQATPCTLSHIISLYPNIGINDNPALGAVVFKAGSGWTSFNGNVDNLTIGINGTNTTYDFDPARVTTEAATGVTTSDATMNGLNGAAAAGNESFWVSTSTIDTSSPIIPVGVYSTQVITGVGANANFSDTLSSLTVTNGAVVNGQVNGTMPAITPGTTYYYVAWVDVNGTWYPGNQETVTIPLPTYTVTIDKFINGAMATAASANSDSFPMVSSWNAANIGSGSGSYALSTSGFNSPNPYEAITSPMSSGASYTTNEVTGGATVGADCSGGQPFALAGYSTGTSLSNAESATMSLTIPNLTNITQNENIIVWNIACAPSVTTDPATNVTAVSTTFNGTNGPVPGTNTSFWWGTTPITGTLTSGSDPASYELPAGWTHDSGSNTAIAANGNFSENESGLMPGTTYYYVAWVEVGGIWYPGNVVSFKTVSTANACSNTNKAPTGFTLVKGAAGNPTVTLSPFEMYVGGAGNPKISAGAGDYIVCLGAGNATVTLGDGSDVIKTGAGNEKITVGDGGAGSSVITTAAGNSTISSTDSGNQKIRTGAGNEKITTGPGNDTIKTGAGNSTINAGGGTNSCSVGAGKSVLTGCSI